MLLSTIFDQLNFGELSQRAFEDPITGKISPENYPKIITNINLGLTELYKRFPIHTKEITLQGYDDILVYNLTDDYAESNIGSVQPIKYILDSGNPFINDILILNRVYSVDSEDVLTNYALNESNNRQSMITPVDKVLKIPYPDSEIQYIIEYKAKPIVVNYLTVTNPEIVEVPLPEQYLEALLNYTSYRIFSGLKNDGSATEATIYYAKFEAACRLLLNYGLDQPNVYDGGQFDTNGWP